MLIYSRTHIRYIAHASSASQFRRRQFRRKNKRSDALDDGAHDPYLSAVSTPQD